MPIFTRRNFFLSSGLGVAAGLFLRPSIGRAQNAPLVGVPNTLSPVHKVVLELAKVGGVGAPYQINGRAFAAPIALEKLEHGVVLEIENKLSFAVVVHLSGHAWGGHTTIAANSTAKVWVDQWPWGGTYYYRFSGVDDLSQTLNGAVGSIQVKDIVMGAFDEDKTLYLDVVSGVIPSTLKGPDRSFFSPLQGLGVEGQKFSFAPKTRARLRLYNLNPWRVMALEFKDIDMFCIALDGRAVDMFRPAKNTLILAPGARMDVAFEMPNKHFKTQLFSRTPKGLVPFFDIECVGALQPNALSKGLPALVQPENLPPQIPLQRALRPKMSLEKGMLKRDGDGRDLTKVAPKSVHVFEAKVGQPVVFAFYNGEDAPASIYLQNATMRLLHPFDDGWEPYWLDTLMAAAGRTVRGAFIPQKAGDYELQVRLALPEAKTTTLTYKVVA